MNRFLLSILLAFSYFFAANAQDQVNLIVTGISNSKEEATISALRSAIEQTYGAFVSSNTSILDDELVKDEIVTISQGNIQSYKELSCVTLADGRIEVQLQATVSISKLVSYAKSKGASVELAGATFGMNMKMYEINKKNERTALWDLFEMLINIPSLFDYKLDVEGPFADEGRYSGAGGYTVFIKVRPYPNENTQLLFDTFYKTLNAIGSAPRGEWVWSKKSILDEYDTMGIEVHSFKDRNDNQKTEIVFLNSLEDKMPPFFSHMNGDCYDINSIIFRHLQHVTIADNESFPKESNLIVETSFNEGDVYNSVAVSAKGSSKLNKKIPYNAVYHPGYYNEGTYIEFKLIIPKEDISKYNQFSVIEEKSPVDLSTFLKINFARRPPYLNK